MSEDWGLMEVSEEDLVEEARWNHEHHPTKKVTCPECGAYSRYPWEKTFGTQNGTIYVWGGVCKRHGPWSDST